MGDILLTGGVLYASIFLAGILAIWTIMNFNFVTLFFTLLIAIAVITTGDYDGTMFMYPLHHPYIVIGSIIVYFGAGAIYSVLKWFLYIKCDDNKLKLKNSFDVFKSEEKQKQISKLKIDKFGYKVKLSQAEINEIDSLMENWTPPTIEDFKNSSLNFLVASKNKMMITTWIFSWPFSLIWTLTHDLIENIYKYLVNVYNKIANKQIDKILGE